MQVFFRRGMTLVEVLVGASVFVGFMLPVFGLLSMGSKGAEYSESWSTAMDIAQSVMERLVSEDVPFVAIEPTGYAGGTAAHGRAQADFRDSFGGKDFSALKLKTILGANSAGVYEKSLSVGFGGEDRVIKAKGYRYRVMLWAGIYNNPVSPEPTGASTVEKQRNNADPTQVMTYIYYPSPWFDLHNDCAFSFSAQISAPTASSSCESLSGGMIDRGRPINPYSQKHGGESGEYFSNGVAYSNPPRAAFRHGYPGKHFLASYPGADPSGVHLRIEDKAFHNKTGTGTVDDGGFMKLVLGVVWEPGLTIDGATRSAGSVSTQQIQEFYLVSFKANLSY